VSNDNDSIAGMTHKSDKKNPLELIQARKAVELLDRFDAKKYDAATYDKAVAALAEAEGNKSAKRIEASKRSVMLSGQALSKTKQMMDAEAAATRSAEAAAERQMLTREAREMQSSLGSKDVQIAQLNQDLERARSQLDGMRARNAKLANQSRSVEQTLSGALGQMATGSKSDRGYTVSLSGVAFRSGQSQLSTEAKYVLAKLSGVLLALPEMKLAIEGHTDSTGSEELNRQLSVSRAEAVSMFLREMGVPSASMTDAGFGPDQPIAPNDTEGGRAKNRRVDIVMME
jgi:outer membrane protein OmpA-like peptidoglycan-associated protein